MALDTFDWIPNTCEEQEIRNVLETRFESGKEQRREKGPPKKRYVMRFTRGSSDADEIYTFYQDHGGPLEPFKLIHPVTEEEIEGTTFRFEQNVFTRRAMQALIYDIGLAIVEVL